eukprot:CAMPEP_0119117352 /NCGR_PEP_ID=MMETSP1180-20130426/52793_1 /TAXON_ID=3052 ORGANISM="Chlamydomonas cf sp, Strain CCMP681" /NCGR_SAMPLE_ID=MMETSP1180 /ASSEMBLY_ACC=CAM_ASM_000741 /LENGTH=32 /DNA_ID= /DNA_START= /DNA_END= /DNA_ORIENTATION=
MRAAPAVAATAKSSKSHLNSAHRLMPANCAPA